LRWYRGESRERCPDASVGDTIPRLGAQPVVTAGTLAIGVLIQLDGPVAWYGGCMLFGASVGNLIILPSLIVQREFPHARFALVVSMVTAVSQLTFAFGPAVLGVMRDVFGHYDQALMLCIVVELPLLRGVPETHNSGNLSHSNLNHQAASKASRIGPSFSIDCESQPSR
jgi:hypothetical protein